MLSIINPRMRTIAVTVMLTLSLFVAGAFALAQQAKAITYYFLSNQSSVGLYVVGSLGGTFTQNPGTTSYYPNGSKWYIGGNWACTYHHPNEASHTYYAGPSGAYLYLNNNSTVVTSCWRWQ